MTRARGAWRRAVRARVLAGALAGALVLVACSGDDPGDEQAVPDSSHLVPSFPPDDDTDAAESAEDGGPPEGPEPTEPDGTATREQPEPSGDGEAADAADQSQDPREADEPDGAGADSAESVEEQAVTSMVTDPRDDTTSPLLGGAPDWADLLAGEVERTDAGDVTLTIELAESPEEPEAGTTMNVASFHDLTGDGDVDLEVWLNHSRQGWFPSWRDNRAGEAAFGDDTGLAVEVTGPTIEVVVPGDLVGRPTSWRWSLGLEWGRYESLGSDDAAHDLAPDEGAVPHG